MNSSTLELIIQLQGQAEQQLNSLRGQVDAVQSSLDAASEHGGAFSTILGGAFQAVGGILTNAAAGGFSALSDAITGGISDAREAAQIMAQTQAVITSTGGAAGVSAQQVADYASSLSAAAGQSLFGDDQIQQSENLLLTFTNIKGAVLEAATAMSVDMAQALGGAPKDSAIQLGKALNDPIKGITALTKVGVTFTEEQKAQIQAMQDAGDTAGAQRVILAELNKEFGGSAAAAAKADGGFAQFKDRIGEVFEGIGTSLLPALQKLPDLLNSTVAPAIEFAAGVISQGLGVAIDFLSSTAIPFLVSAWNGLQPAFASVGNIIATSVIPVFGTLVNWFQVALPQAIAFIITHWEAFKGAIIAIAAVLAGVAIAATIASIVGALAALANPITLIIAAIALLGAAWGENWFGIRDKAAAVWTFLQPIFAQLVGWLQTNIPIAIAAVSSLWTTTLQPALATLGTIISTIVLPALGQLVSIIGTVLPPIISTLGTLWGSLLLPGLQLLGSVLFGTVLPILGQFVTFLVTNIPSAVAVVSTVFQTVVSTVSTTWNSIVSVISTVASAISTAVNVIVTIVTAAWNTINYITSAVWNALYSSAIGPAIAAIQSAVGPVIAGVVSVVSAAWATISATTSTVWSAIQSAITTVTSAVVGVITSVVNAIQSIFGPSMTTVQSQTTTAWQGIQSIIQTVTSVIQTVIQSAVAIIQTVVSGAWSAIVAASEGDFGQISGIISSTWENVKGIFNTAIEDIKSAFNQFISDAVSLGSSIIDGIASGVKNAASSLINSVVNAANDALNAAKKAIGFGSPAEEFIPLGDSIPEGFAFGISRSSPKALTAMLDLASKMIAVVSGGVEAFAKLRDLGSVPQSAVKQFADSIAMTLVEFGNITMAWDRAMMSSASQFAAKAAEAIDLLSKGVDFLVSLQNFQSLPASVFRDFADALDIALREIVDISTRQMLIGLAGAQQFAESAAIIIDIIGKAVDAFAKIQTFSAPAEEIFHQFALALVAAVGWISHVAAWFQAGAASSAAQFASSASKVIEIIGTGVDSFAKLKDFSAPTYTQFQQFSIALSNAVGWITHIAGWFRGYAIGAAAEFAQSAGTMIGIISGAVDAFTKLNELKAVPGAAWQAFSAALAQTVVIIRQIATGWTKEAIELVGMFSEGAGKAIAIIGGAVDGFVKLFDLKAVPAASFTAFEDGLRAALLIIGNISAKWTPEAITLVAQFADGAGRAIAIVGTGVDAFTKLADMKDIAPAAMYAFQAALDTVILIIAAISYKWSGDAITQAVTFAQSATRIIDLISHALDAFGKLADFSNTSSGVIDAFTSGLTSLLAELQRQVLPAATNIGANIMLGMINGILSGRSALIQIIINTINAAIAAATSALGIASESKVFKQQIGVQVGAGLASGLKSQVPVVSSAAMLLANATIAPAPRTPATVAATQTGAINRSSDMQPAQHYDFSGMVINAQPGQDGKALANQFYAEIKRKLEDDTRRR